MKSKNNKKPQIKKDQLELGQLLAYREQCKVSLAKISSSIKLSKTIVEKIESGDFENIGAPTYVRGHLRNYCKYLGIDPQVILKQLPDNLVVKQSVYTPDSLMPKSISKVRLQSSYIGKYVVGTVLLAVLAGSFYFVLDKWDIVNNNPQELLATEDATIDVPETLDTGVEKDKKQQRTYSSLIPQIVDSEPKEGKEDEEIISSIDFSGTALNDETINVENENLAKYSIEFDLQEQSWVEIKTVTGDVVEMDLIGPGVVRYQAGENIKFKIGNASKVNLKINDEIIGLQAHTYQNVANFQWPIDRD
ncbi:MAG: DUF4115 domain-containing protein [Proteobacteria bacterium]|nr:DUF4115 domain-containing protein [Pseudomonadota bacterium]